MILKLALQFALQVDLENRGSERELTKAVSSLAGEQWHALELEIKAD